MFSATADGRIVGQNRTYDSREVMMRELSAEAASSWPRPVVFVAGHFMLMYSAEAGALIPMIAADAVSSADRAFIRARVGDFPIDTLGIAAGIIHAMPADSAGIALLVNDHQFQRFQPEVPREEGTKLVRRFYRETATIPSSFAAVLRAHDIDAEAVIVRNDRPPRRGRGLLPKLSPFFSEKNLRNTFNDKTVTVLAENERFGIEHGSGVRRVLHLAARATEPACLTDDSARCGCSGEVLEFLREMSKSHGGAHQAMYRPAATVVFLVPDECSVAVRSGMVAGMDVFHGIAHGIVIDGFAEGARLRSTSYRNSEGVHAA